MKLIKNKLNFRNLQTLPLAINSFYKESGLGDVEESVKGTMRNVSLGVQRPVGHDTWTDEEGLVYCLCKNEKDIDGRMVYTAYQLWIHPSLRQGKCVQDIIHFLRFYAQKQGYARLYVISSRIDKIKAYARGLGKGFKIKYVTFVNEF